MVAGNRKSNIHSAWGAQPPSAWAKARKASEAANKNPPKPKPASFKKKG